MFQELMPLLGQRIVILTLSDVSDEEIRVNIIPKPLKADQRDDDAALTTPLGVYGYSAKRLTNSCRASW
jgi:hypothetical protein